MKESDLLRQAFDAVPAMIWLKDKNNVILRANAAAAASIGRTVAEVEGKSTYDLYPELAAKYYEDDLEVIRTGKPKLGYIEQYELPSGQNPWVRTDKMPYRDEKGEIVGVLVFAIDISGLKKSEADLKASCLELRELSAYLESVREAERAKFAHEIHDELGQQLTVLKLDFFRRLEKLSAEDAESFSARVDELIHSLRKISSELRPIVLDDLGLEAALEWLCEEFRVKTGLDYSFRSRMLNFDVPPAKATALFRICQEALTNAARHAGARSVTVDLRAATGEFVLEVRDNGGGISSELTNAQRTFGLEGMRERALSVGGTLVIEGAAGKGTIVTARVPVE